MKMSRLFDHWDEKFGSDGHPVAVSTFRELWDPEVVAWFTLDGEPQSKARARVTFKNGKAGAYTPRQTQAAEEAVAWKFRQSGGRGPDAESTFGVFAAFFCGTRQRRDVDNMIKLILDGLNKVAWVDDAQVSEVTGRVLRAVPDARTEVVVYKTGAVSNPTAQCAECGKAFRTYPSMAKKRYCSDACRLAVRRAARRRTCEQCGKEWDPGKPSTARFCSRECFSNSGRMTAECAQCGSPFTKSMSSTARFCKVGCQRRWAREHGTAVRKGTCTDCGGPVSRREYIRCRGCWSVRQTTIKDVS